MRLRLAATAAAVIMAGCLTPAAAHAETLPAPTDLRGSIERNWVGDEWLQFSWDMSGWPSPGSYGREAVVMVDGVEVCSDAAHPPGIPPNKCKPSEWIVDSMRRGQDYTVKLTVTTYDWLDLSGSTSLSATTQMTYRLPESSRVEPTPRSVKLTLNPTATDWPTFAPLRPRYRRLFRRAWIGTKFIPGDDAKVLSLRATAGKYKGRKTLSLPKGRHTIKRTVTFRPIVWRKKPVTLRPHSYELGQHADMNYTCNIANWVLAPGTGLPADDYNFTLFCTIPKVSLTPITVALNGAYRDDVATMPESSETVVIPEQQGIRWVRGLGPARTLTTLSRVVVR